MFLTALFITSKRWQQSKHPSADEWVNKTWFYPSNELLLHLKKECSTDACPYLNELQKYYA